MKRKLGIASYTTLLFLLTCLNVSLVAQSCASRTPKKAVVDSLFLTGKAVNDAYAGYLDGIFDHTIKTNSFPKVTADYELFQQFFGAAVKELPGTNGVRAAVLMGRQVITDVSVAKKVRP